MRKPDAAALLYRREGDMIRFATQNQTNHELREVMVGIWARLDRADRADHIKELQHYFSEPQMHLSPVASAIARADTAGIPASVLGVAPFTQADFDQIKKDDTRGAE